MKLCSMRQAVIVMKSMMVVDAAMLAPTGTVSVFHAALSAKTKPQHHNHPITLRSTASQQLRPSCPPPLPAQ